MVKARGVEAQRHHETVFGCLEVMLFTGLPSDLRQVKGCKALQGTARLQAPSLLYPAASAKMAMASFPGITCRAGAVISQRLPNQRDVLLLRGIIGPREGKLAISVLMQTKQVRTRTALETAQLRILEGLVCVLDPEP